MERGSVLALVVAGASIAISMSVAAWMTSAPTMTARQAPAPAAARAGAPPSAEEIDARIHALEDRLEKNPGDLAGWKMLGRSYMAKDLYMQAVGAYVRAAQIDPRDPEVAGALKQLEGVARGKGRHEDVPRPR